MRTVVCDHGQLMGRRVATEVGFNFSIVNRMTRPGVAPEGYGL